MAATMMMTMMMMRTSTKPQKMTQTAKLPEGP